MSTRYNFLNDPPEKCNIYFYVGIGLVLSLHIILTSIIVSNVLYIVPEINRTLQEVNIIVPEIKLSLSDVVEMLPEMKHGLKVLKQLCEHSPNCDF